MSMSSLHGPTPLKAGFMHKAASAKGEDHCRGNWKLRYFQLHASRLDYYRRERDNEAAGSIDLRDAQIEPIDAESADGRRNCLKISEAKQVFVYVQAESAADRDGWLRALRVQAGIEEDSEDLTASIVAAHLKERSINMCCFGVLIQDVKEATPPESAVIVLGPDGNLRIYKEKKLWRTFDSSQIVKIDSNGKAENGLGIGMHWRLLCEVRFEVKVPDKPANLVFAALMSTEEECAMFLDFFRGLLHNNLAPLARVSMKQPLYSANIELHDASFRTGWAGRFAVLAGFKDRLILFLNSNSPSPDRSIYFGSDLEVTKEEGCQMKIQQMIEREPHIIKFSSDSKRNQWYGIIIEAVEAARARKQQKIAEEEARIRAGEEAQKTRRFKPLTATNLNGDSSTAPVVKAKRLSLADLDFDPLAPPPPPSQPPPSLFDFVHPTSTNDEDLSGDDASFVLTFGCGASGQLGTRSKEDALKPALVESLQSKRVRRLAAGWTHAGVVTDQGHVYVFGTGALGLGERMVETRSPQLVTSLLKTPIHSLSCGRGHTLALTMNGSVFSWGSNEQGQCGLGHCDPVFYPSSIDAAAFGGRKVLRISAGTDHSAAIVEEKLYLYTWGAGTMGCLGVGNTEKYATPQPVPSLNKRGKVAMVSCGQDFTLAALIDGSAFACGNNHEGQLGMGDRNRRSLFAQIQYFSQKHLRVFHVSAGSAHSVALAVTHSNPTEPLIYTFGSGILNGFREGQLTPIHVSSLPATHSTSASSTHTLALNRVIHRPFSFGINKFGELGNGAAAVQALVKVRLNTSIQVVDVAAGAGFSMLLCKGTPPNNLLPTTAPSSSSSSDTALPSAPTAFVSSSGHPVSLSGAVDDIAKVLQMEAKIVEEQTGTKTNIQAGSIDILTMESIGADGKPLATSSSSSSPPVAPTVVPASTVASSSSSSTVAPAVQSTAATASSAPFTFSLESTAAIPLPSHPPAPSSNLAPASPSSDVASDAKKRRKSLKAPLPPGWKKVKDPESGHSYYFHQTTKQTTWKRPKLEEETEAEAPPPPPPPPPEEEMPPPPPPDEAATIEPPPPPPDSNTDEPPPPPPDE